MLENLGLVTDRTDSDYLLMQSILSKPSQLRTASEQALLDSGIAKGSYNISDLNRVSRAVQILSSALNAQGYALNIKVVPSPWVEGYEPSKTDLLNYFENIYTVYNAVFTAQNLPTSIEQLTTYGANQIEQALLDVDEQIKYTIAVFLHSAQPFLYSGYAMYYPKEHLQVYTADGLPVYTGEELPVYAY